MTFYLWNLNYILVYKFYQICYFREIKFLLSIRIESGKIINLIKYRGEVISILTISNFVKVESPSSTILRGLQVKL